MKIVLIFWSKNIPRWVCREKNFENHRGTLNMFVKNSHVIQCVGHFQYVFHLLLAAILKFFYTWENWAGAKKQIQVILIPKLPSSPVITVTYLAFFTPLYKALKESRNTIKFFLNYIMKQININFKKKKKKTPRLKNMVTLSGCENLNSCFKTGLKKW